jgi:hypothetical protein
MNRTCIIVSPYFPPSTLAGVHRARHLAKHLPATGWTPIVVCVDEAFHEEYLDPALASLVPPSVKIVKVGAIPQRMSRSLGLGEISLRAWRQLRAGVMRLLEKGDVSAVLITGSPYYPMLFGAEIKRRFGVPVILDFQDPWVSAWGAAQPRFSKTGAAHRLATLLEPQAVAAADFITSVSETQNAQMRARYPHLTAERMAAIPIGGDPADYDALRQTPADDRFGLLRPGVVTLCYVGTCMPRTGPLLEVLFEAFARARREHPGSMADVRMVFVGTSNQPNDLTTKRVLPLAEKAGVADAVHEVPQRVPFLDALALLARADGILMVGSDEPHYTASKIYPGLMSGRPYLSLFHLQSSSHEVLSRSGGGIAIGFDGAGALPGLAGPLAEAIVRLITAPSSLGRANPAGYADFTAANVAKRFGHIFDTLDVRRAPAV